MTTKEGALKALNEMPMLQDIAIDKLRNNFQKILEAYHDLIDSVKISFNDSNLNIFPNLMFVKNRDEDAGRLI